MRALVLVGFGLLVASCGRRNFNDDAMQADTVTGACDVAPPDCTDPVVYACGIGIDGAWEDLSCGINAPFVCSRPL